MSGLSVSAQSQMLEGCCVIVGRQGRQLMALFEFIGEVGTSRQVGRHVGTA
ncbi:hypothetical protein [Rhizobium sp. LEGMi135b]